ncbi:MAG: hypothetical protein V3V62_00285 [bacterium]
MRLKRWTTTVTMTKSKALALILLAGFVAGCGQGDGGPLGTGSTVRQEKPAAARGLGGYRTVRMPMKARRNLVEAPKGAPGAAAYSASIGSR